MKRDAQESSIVHTLPSQVHTQDMVPHVRAGADENTECSRHPGEVQADGMVRSSKGSG